MVIPLIFKTVQLICDFATLRLHVCDYLHLTVIVIRAFKI